MKFHRGIVKNPQKVQPTVQEWKERKDEVWRLEKKNDMKDFEVLQW